MRKLLKSAMIATALMAAPTAASAATCSTGSWSGTTGNYVVPCTFAAFWATIGTMSASTIAEYVGTVGGNFSSATLTTATGESWGGVLSFSNPMATFTGAKTVTDIVFSPFSLTQTTTLINQTQAVPGPIAGAGLPLLAVGAAFVAWRRRRAAA